MIHIERRPFLYGLYRHLRFRPLLALLSLAVVATVLTVGGSSSSLLPTQPTADLSRFDAGNIISDQVFFFGAGMSTPDIQSFLVARNPRCVAAADGTPCLQNYSQDTTSIRSDAQCSGYTGAPRESAATIIAKVGVSCNINPKVLLVTLQKERGLVTASGSALDPSDYRISVGYGCPDTGPCDPTKMGFLNQIYHAAWQFQYYAHHPADYAYRAGRTVNILYNPSAACGSSPVYIQNQATAGLYIYTPYQPNAAALRGGSGDGCSAFGNRNFWVYFTDWFISTQSDAIAAASPKGNAELVALTPNGFTASGWAFDPDAWSSPVSVQVTVDGWVASTTSAGASRPDVATAYGINPEHGFTVSGDLRYGTHQVCIQALNLAGLGTQVQLGCQTLNFTNQAPILQVDQFQEQADGSVQISGWAVDPDRTQAQVHVYDNGVGRAYPMTVARPDVQQVHPEGGATSGFSATVGPLTGTHSVCLFAVDTVAPGNNWLSRCPTFSYQAPIGRVDAADEDPSGSGGLSVSGWVYDPSLPATSMEAHVYLDGRGVAVLGNQSRPDIAAAFPGAGSAHGFSTIVPTTEGAHSLCVFGYNIGIAGTNPVLSCRDITMQYRAPIGNVELIGSAGAGQVVVTGWAFDPSAQTVPMTMHVWVDGRPHQAVTADVARPDLPRFYPGAGPNHGFSATMPLDPGSHQVCVFGINNGVPGPNPLMACKIVTVTASP
jgi:hypothetical protein